jgi:ABC-type lipoprotein release transport system permease subunit
VRYPRLDTLSLLVAICAATAAGVIAGLLPGLRAVKITPSQALRRD